MEKEVKNKPTNVNKNIYKKYRTYRTGEDIDMLNEKNKSSTHRSICDISEDGA